MNRPVATGKRPSRAAQSRYDADFYSWAMEQASLLQAGRVSEVDAVNLADEVKDLGNEQYDKLRIALAVLLAHLLKWDHQPEMRSRSWESTVREQRRRAQRVLTKNPGLQSRRDEAASEGYLDGRDRASAETDLDVGEFPQQCPYSWEQIMTREIKYDPSSPR
jgi:hypothetical protein